MIGWTIRRLLGQKRKGPELSPAERRLDRAYSGAAYTFIGMTILGVIVTSAHDYKLERFAVAAVAAVAAYFVLMREGSAG